MKPVCTYILQSVQRFVALMTTLGIQEYMQTFTWLKPHYNFRALIFYMCEGLSQTHSQTMKHAQNYGTDIFDYEGHDL